MKELSQNSGGEHSSNEREGVMASYLDPFKKSMRKVYDFSGAIQGNLQPLRAVEEMPFNRRDVAQTVDALRTVYAGLARIEKEYRGEENGDGEGRHTESPMQFVAAKRKNLEPLFERFAPFMPRQVRDAADDQSTPFAMTTFNNREEIEGFERVMYGGIKEVMQAHDVEQFQRNFATTLETVAKVYGSKSDTSSEGPTIKHYGTYVAESDFVQGLQDLWNARLPKDKIANFFEVTKEPWSEAAKRYSFEDDVCDPASIGALEDVVHDLYMQNPNHFSNQNYDDIKRVYDAMRGPYSSDISYIKNVSDVKSIVFDDAKLHEPLDSLMQQLGFDHLNEERASDIIDLWRLFTSGMQNVWDKSNPVKKDYSRDRYTGQFKRARSSYEKPSPHGAELPEMLGEYQKAAFVDAAHEFEAFVPRVVVDVESGEEIILRGLNSVAEKDAYNQSLTQMLTTGKELIESWREAIKQKAIKQVWEEETFDDYTKMAMQMGIDDADERGRVWPDEVDEMAGVLKNVNERLSHSAGEMFLIKHRTENGMTWITTTTNGEGIAFVPEEGQARRKMIIESPAHEEHRQLICGKYSLTSVEHDHNRLTVPLDPRLLGARDTILIGAAAEESYGSYKRSL